jgi:hypothetical protein
VIVTGLTTLGLVYLFAAYHMAADMTKEGAPPRTSAVFGLFWPAIVLWAFIARLVG